MTPRPHLLATLVLPLLVGCQKGAQDAKAASARPPLEPRTVQVAVAGNHPLPRTVQVSGTLGADEEAELGFKVQGRVATVHVDLGSKVEKGQPLAVLETSDFELRVQQALAALQQARARLGLQLQGDDFEVDPEQIAVVGMARSTLDEARQNRDRVQELVKQQLRSDSDLDAARAAFELAKAKHQDALEEVRQRQAVATQRRAELALARQQLADATLVAPFDGAIRERRVSPGRFVSAGGPVFVIVKTDPLRLRLQVPERESSGVRIGQPVTLTLEGDPVPHRGEIARLAPAIGESNRTLTVEAKVENRDGALRPGAFARATIVVEAAAPTLCIPKSALVTFAGIEKVVTVKDAKAEERRVRTGRSDDVQVEILEGLEAGTTVVLAPAALVTGQPLVIAK